MRTLKVLWWRIRYWNRPSELHRRIGGMFSEGAVAAAQWNLENQLRRAEGDPRLSWNEWRSIK